MDLDRNALDRHITGNYGEDQFSQVATTGAYIVGWNMTGYSPEMEPYALDNYDDAKQALISDMLNHAENIDTWADPHDCDDIPCPTYGDDCPNSLAAQVTDSAEDLALSSGPEWGTIVGHMSYWINYDSTLNVDDYNGEVN